MLKRITHLFLVISLLGQFLLTPAMALPDLLHTASKNQTAASELYLQRTSSASAQAKLINFFSVDSEITESQQQLAQLGDLESDYVLDCETFCQELASGHCTTHGGCTSGLYHLVSLALQFNLESERVADPLWSVKTVTLHIVNPPPIA
ncbi:hypothetical protein JK628_19450 [Shewanella sp. KX20019]|uniref:hypothetical protein n=1 Tax=Shewanella sp. KX20019 TaxID=2803864 RepID=UPI0019297476|nr:hypothetical protein [Shewanella sp. KX20019]QQX79665.1 hypothetical protein JK628_19450 [Shewanella sp. KX20019]